MQLLGGENVWEVRSMLRSCESPSYFCHVCRITRNHVMRLRYWYGQMLPQREKVRSTFIMLDCAGFWILNRSLLAPLFDCKTMDLALRKKGEKCLMKYCWKCFINVQRKQGVTYSFGMLGRRLGSNACPPESQPAWWGILVGEINAFIRVNLPCFLHLFTYWRRSRR